MLDKTETVRVPWSSRDPSTPRRPLDWEPYLTGFPSPFVSDCFEGNLVTFVPVPQSTTSMTFTVSQVEDREDGVCNNGCVVKEVVLDHS